MDITKKSVVELKALAFDIIIDLERQNKNLNIINAEIGKKEEEERSKPKK